MISPNTCYKLLSLMVFFTCSQKCMLHYVVRVILLKFRLKDKSSLISLEGNKSLVSRTFKEQNHISCNVFSEAPSGIVSGGRVALAAVLIGCTSLVHGEPELLGQHPPACLSRRVQGFFPSKDEGEGLYPKHTGWITTSGSHSS